MSQKNTNHVPSINRRQFLKLIGLSGLSTLLANCRPFEGIGITPTLTRAVSPTAGVDTPAPLSPSTSVFKALAAIGRVENYELEHLYDELKKMLEGIGGLADIVKPGAHVGIKPNLTGGTGYDSSLPLPTMEIYVTHPAVIGALIRLLYEAGASKVTVLEALGDDQTYSAWGYTELARSLGVNLVDLNKPDPYPKFETFAVGPAYNIYEAFLLNPALKGVDVFVSVAKMKCHATAGVTLSMKNLFGIVPVSPYRRKVEDGHRSAFHSEEKFDRRVPRIIVDLNRARPVHLSLIDGIITSEGGEGPWIKGLNPIRPGLLVAGKNPVATDSVAAALMGFDPAGVSGKMPFIHGENHIALAGEAGLGSNDISKVSVFGPSIDSVRFPFKPVPLEY